MVFLVVYFLYNSQKYGELLSSRIKCHSLVSLNRFLFCTKLFQFSY